MASDKIGTHKTAEKVVSFKTNDQKEFEEAREVFIEMLEGVIAELRAGEVRRVMLITDGDETESRMYSQYNRYLFGRMRKAEAIGLAFLAAHMSTDDGE